MLIFISHTLLASYAVRRHAFANLVNAVQFRVIVLIMSQKQEHYKTQQISKESKQARDKRNHIINTLLYTSPSQG